MEIKLHEKQGRAFLSPATEILYGGAAGGGKSHLLRACAISWCYDIPGLQFYLFRRQSDDLYKNHMDGPSGFIALLAEWVEKKWAKINTSRNYIEFFNGSKIHLCHCQYEKHVYKYQGAEIHVLAIDELTHFTKTMYRYLRSRVRIGGLKLPDRYKGLFPRILNGSNPGNIGHNWVNKDFVVPGADVVHKVSRAEGGMLRQFIKSLLEDNPTMLENDPDYDAKLEGLGSPALVKAMRLGDWNIIAGGMFDDKWNESVHVIDPFPIPRTWSVFRAFDWGSDKPFSVGWWAKSDGCDVRTPDGRFLCYPRGTLIRIAEWYGSTGDDNQGLRLTAREIAAGILQRQAENPILSRLDIVPGPADSSIFSKDRGEDHNSIAEDMEDEGVYWEYADKSPGSRVRGWELVRTRMNESLKSPMENPGLFVFRTCRHFTSLIPVMPRDAHNSEDLDTNAEDHIADEMRYAVLDKPSTASAGKVRGVY